MLNSKIGIFLSEAFFYLEIDNGKIHTRLLMEVHVWIKWLSNIRTENQIFLLFFYLSKEVFCIMETDYSRSQS